MPSSHNSKRLRRSGHVINRIVVLSYNPLYFFYLLSRNIILIQVEKQLEQRFGVSEKFLSSVKDDLSLRVLLVVAFWLDFEENE